MVSLGERLSARPVRAKGGGLKKQVSHCDYHLHTHFFTKTFDVIFFILP